MAQMFQTEALLSSISPESIKRKQATKDELFLPFQAPVMQVGKRAQKSAPHAAMQGPTSIFLQGNAPRCYGAGATSSHLDT